MQALVRVVTKGRLRPAGTRQQGEESGPDPTILFKKSTLIFDKKKQHRTIANQS